MDTIEATKTSRSVPSFPDRLVVREKPQGIPKVNRRLVRREKPLKEMIHYGQ